MQRGSTKTLRETLDLFYDVAHPLTGHTISSGNLSHCLAVAIARVQRLVALSLCIWRGAERVVVVARRHCGPFPRITRWMVVLATQWPPPLERGNNSVAVIQFPFASIFLPADLGTWRRARRRWTQVGGRWTWDLRRRCC